MVRANGAVLSDVRYRELQDAEVKKSPTVAQRLNLFFFDSKTISLSDFLWFYGSLIIGGAVAIISLLALISI
ncbi:hypothetical protein ABEU97_20575 [Priestia megaterium]